MDAPPAEGDRGVMRLAFLKLPAGERKAYIDEASARRGLSPVIVEKDFWVCWLLSVLFESSFRDAVVFKGGTSLSKVFGVINRFSEDIDLSLAPAFLGLDEPDATAALSKGQASKWMERAEATCTTVVRTLKVLAESAYAIGERFVCGRLKVELANRAHDEWCGIRAHPLRLQEEFRKLLQRRLELPHWHSSRPDGATQANRASPTPWV